MLDTLITFSICLFEIYIYYDFLHNFLEESIVSKKAKYAALVLMSGAMYGINSFQISQLNLFGIAFLFLFGTLVLFYGDLKTKITCCLVFYIIILGMEFVVGVLFSVIGMSGFVTKNINLYNNFYLIIITKLMTFVVLRAVKLFMNRKVNGISGKLFKMTFLLPITTILLYTGLYYANIQMEHGRLLLSIGCVLLLFSNILMFYILEKLTSVMEQNTEYRLMELQNSYQNLYYEKLEEVGDKHKKYAHDLKHYLQTICGLAYTSQNSDIIALLNEMEVKIDAISDKIYTDNSILNALLCEKKEYANSLGIQFNIMIEPTLDLSFVTSGDLIVMVGNLISNAIEAASICKYEKMIDLKFFESDGNFIVLDIENTYGNEIIKKGTQYFSTKKETGYHGIGLKSVQDIANRYGGILFLEQKEKTFVSILTLSKTQC